MSVEVITLDGFREDLVESLTIPLVVPPERAESIVTNLENVVTQKANEGATKIVVPALVATASLSVLAIVLALRAR
jgi:hypothetical protein